MKKIVVRLMASHPTGSRRRAGFVFTESPCQVEVDNDQLKQIKEDPYLHIIEKGTALAQGKENIQKVKVVEKAEEVKEEPKAVELEEKPTPDNGSKEEIIKKLISKGLKDGIDFNSDAEYEALEILLTS